MILHNPYAGHAKWWSEYLYGERWEPDATLANVWTPWDYVLADVYQIITDYTNPNSGQLRWWDESEDVDWDTEELYSGYMEAVEKARKGQKEPKPGYEFVAYPQFRDPDHKPTMRDWAESRKREYDEPTAKFAEPPRGGPPTAADLAAMQEAGY